MHIETIRFLYHGSGVWFDEVDLSYAKGFKDFGAGFYLTSDFNQAQKWAQKSSG